MPKMIATSNIEYPPGSCFEPGDSFEVEDAHVNLLTITGRAKLPDESTPDEAPPIEGTLHAKRKYTRRAT